MDQQWGSYDEKCQVREFDENYEKSWKWKIIKVTKVVLSQFEALR